MSFKGGWFEIFHSWFSFFIECPTGGGVCSLRIKCQNPDVQIKVKFQAIGNLRYLTINGSLWTYAWTASPVWPPAAPFASWWRWRTRAARRRSLGDTQSQTVWSDSVSLVLSQTDTLVLLQSGAAECAKRRGKEGRISPSNMCSYAIWTCKWVFFFFVEVSLQGEVGYGGKEGNPFMYYQMFPFRNPRLFSILSLKRMCSRLYPARQN